MAAPNLNGAAGIHESSKMASQNDNRFRNSEFYNWLQDHRSSTQSETTMTGMGNPKGIWTIEDDEYPIFLNYLHDWLFIKKQSPANFVERPRGGKEPKPILIDLDFKYPKEKNLERTFNMGHIQGFTHQVIEGLKAFFDLSSFDELRFFVCLRPIPYRAKDKDNKVKDGIHIECRDMSLSNEKQKVLRNWLLEQNAVSGAFEGTGFLDKDADVYDATSTNRQGWFFYGESKPEIPAYSLQEVFVYSPAMDEISTEPVEKYKPRQLLELLSIRYGIEADANDVREDAKEEYSRLLAWKPAAAEVTNQVIQPVGTVAAHGEKEKAGSSELTLMIRSAQKKNECTADDLAFIRSLVIECLSVKRAENYDDWKKVGWALNHISVNEAMSEKLFDLYMDFSRKSSKSSENNEVQLRREWNYMDRPTGQKKLQFASLQYWAREDNPGVFTKLIEEDLIRYVAIHTQNTHNHIAQIMSRLYGDQFKASTESKKTEWFTYQSEHHVWHQLKQGMDLRCKISNEVVDKVQKAREKAKIIYGRDESTGDLSELAAKRVKELLAVEKSLYTANFKDSVMKECAEELREEDFINRLNLNPYLMACKNGVLNLRVPYTGPDGKEKFKVEFRNGRPDDLISFVAGLEFGISEPIEYVPYDPDSEEAKDLNVFLSQIYPRPELRKFVLTLLSSCLEGMNREQGFYYFTGIGGNGKSKIIELMRMVLGEYQTGLAPTALTRKRPDSGAANPDIIAIKNKRFIYLQEPDEREPLNTSRMKQFSGEDIIEARGLYGDQEKFKVNGKLFLLCNALPPILSMDRGTWRRVKVVPHESCFVSEGDIKYPDLLAGLPNMFHKDMTLDLKLKKWRVAFLGLLVKTYEEVYCVEGLKEPAIIKESSMAYKERFDSFAAFRNVRIRKVIGERADFKIINIAYKNWCEWQGGTGRKLNQQDLKKRLEDEFGAPEDGKIFRGIQLFENDEDVEAWDLANPS